MKRFIFLSLLMLVWQAMPAQCPAPVVTASDPTTFCAGGSVTLSAPAGNVWTQKADFGGTGRYSATGFSIGNKGYVGTGYDGSNSFKDFWEYDPSTNVWTQKADFGGGVRFAAVGFSIGNKGYIGTGVSSTYHKDFWEYDPATNVWTRKADFGGTERQGATGFSIGSKGFIGTGWNNLNDIFYKDFWEYTPSTNVWAQKADFGGTARYFATGFSIGSKGYIGTGAISGTFYKDFWEYNPVTNVWIQKPDFGGVARYAATGFSIGNKGYIGTGGNSFAFKDFWEYNASTNVWAQKADFGGGVLGYTTSFSIGNKGYIGTGNVGGNNRKDFWEYDPGYTYSWSPGGQTTSSITVSTAGNYTLTTTNALGCSATSAAATVTVNPATQITTQPQSTTTCKGSSVSFSVTATGSNLIYKWFRNGQSISNNAATLTISNAQASNSGSYTVDVIGDCGTVTSAAATLLVYDNNNGAIYVDNGVSASGSGASWATAYKELREALNAAYQCSNITTINVAKGTYKPANNTNRDSAFTILRGGLKIYGGYPSGGGTRSITANPTILSGDISTVGNTSDNSYHVLVIAGLASSADSVVIDGFTITGGNANDSATMNYGTTPAYQGNGGGAYIINNANGRKIALRNLTVSNNAAGYVAGGFEINNSSPLVANCTFSNNSSIYGGGMFNEVTAAPLLVNCLFVSNNGSSYGGGIYNHSTSAPAVTNCTFYANSSGGGGGTMYNGSASPLLNSCIIWGNTGPSPGISNNSSGTVVKYSLVQGLSGGTGNLNTDPLFVNTLDANGADNIWGTSDDGLKLQAGSPAINTGSNPDIPAGITTDITGAARIQNGTVDMGAYEGSTVILPLTLLQFKGTAINSKDALLNWRTVNEVNTGYFELQRSTSSRSFTTVATLQAKGTAQSETEYNYTDKGLPAGMYYYRLKMVDKDGKETYSQVVAIAIKGSNTITLYPVPAKSFVWLDGTTATLVGKNVQLMDVQGRILQVIRISQWPQRVDVSTFAAGTYLIKVEGEKAMPFIKQ